MIPKTFLVGCTALDYDGLFAYLDHTNNNDFKESLKSALDAGVCPGHALCSFYAKLCYRSLTLGKNANITKTRDIVDNLDTIIASGHGSVLEHCWLNFVTMDCSRVFTHELVRHRVGTAFSQTSGRYVSVEDAEIVLPPDAPAEMLQDMGTILDQTKRFNAKWRDKLRLNEPGTSFSFKKHWTSQLRRAMPNGATNEIGWSCNIRALRHMIQMRTSRHAEWEMRVVFNDVADIILQRWPLMLAGHEAEDYDGLKEYLCIRI